MSRSVPVLRLVAAAVGAVALSGCATPVATDPGVLEGTPWSLVTLGGKPLPTLPLARVPRFELTAGRVAGMSGCNRLVGGYTLAGQALRFGPSAGTRMACVEGMVLESEVLAMLGRVAGWRVRDGQLELLDDGGAEIARWASNLRSYHCGAFGTVLVRYQGTGATAGATLAFGEREFQMRAAPVASGARYVVEQGRLPDMSMEWRTKGDEGQLLEAPLSDSRTLEDLKAFATCRSR